MLLLEDKLTKIANRISHIPLELGVEEDSDYDGYFECIRDQVETSNDVNAEWGASKLVYLIDGVSKVIKIPFNGMWTYVEDYDEETDEYINGENVFEEFCGAVNGNNCWDYCGREAELYDMAEEAGFGKFFAKTELFIIIDNYPIYIQDRAIPFWTGKKIFSSSEKSKKYSYDTFTYKNDNFHGYSWIDDEWVGLAIDLYGKEEVEAFLIFLKENSFNDLHTGNIGYTQDGKPIIIDYSGFNS